MIKNCDLLREIALSRQQGNVMTPALARMIVAIPTDLAKKSNFRNYSYKEEFIGESICQLAKVWHKFDETKGQYPNPFSYFTAICYNMFRRVLREEKKNQQVRDEYLVKAGVKPSSTMQAEWDLGWNTDLVQPPSPGIVFKYQRGRAATVKTDPKPLPKKRVKKSPSK